LLLDLCLRGHRVRAFRRPASSLVVVHRVFSGKEDLLEQVEWFEGDLLDLYDISAALQGVRTVFHAAALVSFAPADRELLLRVNRDVTADLVNASLESGIEWFGYVSSVAALGRTEEGVPVDEQTLWKTSKHNTYYAISKYGGEREVWRGVEEGLRASIVNPTIVLGPGDWNIGSSALFRRVYHGLRLYPLGTTGFVDVRDVSEALIRCWEKRLSGERFLINAEHVSYRQLLSWMSEGFGTKPPSIPVQPWMAELAWRWESLSSRLSGRKPLVTRETARSSQRVWHYRNEKAKSVLGMDFIPVRTSVLATCRIFLDAVGR
jgi:nucleoside-diphosphate-sugar epimerase